MMEIAKGILVENHYQGGNVGLVLTGKGALLIDTPMIPHEAEAWLGAVSSLAAEGLAYIINPDYDPQRVLGNHFFSLPVIAHEYTYTELEARGQAALQRQIDLYKKRDPRIAAQLADVEIVLPQIAVTDQLIIHRGDHQIELIHFGGHSAATIGVYIPAARVLFAGDLVWNQRHPDLSQANTSQWIAALDRIADMELETLVPGIGEPCDLSAIPPLKAYIADMSELVTQQFNRGASRREAVDRVRNAMAERFPVPSRERDATVRRLKASIERIYEEARKAAA